MNRLSEAERQSIQALIRAAKVAPYTRKQTMDWTKGFRMVAFGLATAVLPAAVEYLGHVDVTAVFGLSPAAGAVIGSIIMTLRYFTTSPIFKR